MIVNQVEDGDFCVPNFSPIRVLEIRVCCYENIFLFSAFERDVRIGLSVALAAISLKVRDDLKSSGA